MNSVLHFITVVFCFACFTVLHAATGIVPVSFKDVCLPALEGQEALLTALAAFDIKDTGSFLTGGAAVPPLKQEDIRFAPFAFLARSKGSKGDYDLLLIVHHGYRLMPSISFEISPSAKYGIVILPRDLAPDDPLLKFAK